MDNPLIHILPKDYAILRPDARYVALLSMFLLPAKVSVVVAWFSATKTIVKVTPQQLLRRRFNDRDTTCCASRKK